MTPSIAITPRGPLFGTIRPPGSKSITNRALACAALSTGESVLTGALDSDDTRVMIDSLGRLGIDVAVDLAKRELRVQGCGGAIPRAQADLFIGNSGTTVRFLAALVALGEGTYRLDGTARMRERPIRDLLVALGQLGADAVSEAGTDCPPVVIRASGLKGGVARVRGDVSSQFLSGLLQAAPYAKSPVELIVEGELVSKPYVTMTLDVMRAFGVDVPHDESLARFTIPRGQYRGLRYAIEPDASAASYFFAAAAITGGEITVAGLSRHSLQGDVGMVDLLERMGCQVTWREESITVRGGKLRGITADMNAISDTVQTLSAVAIFAEGPTTITGVPHIRHKETDRLAAMATELRKLGAQVDEFADGLTITPAPLHGAEIDTYDDHRMAMSMALTGLRVPGVVIRDPGCTSKTYPEFFRDLDSLTES
ncbi:MAG: 3-phosphoshikimate 1-carboxyvinyltransferase [Planctomycetaceae bacterium]|nr:3-phosphoshikimate 1-carboxyvinyltransferase [Planctomycetaceae bacterium]